jgi:hypothetical protein
MNLTKMLLPAVVGLALVGGVVSWWVGEIIHLSYRTEGTMFSKYKSAYPESKNWNPSESFFCDPAYKTRWAGCSLK